MGKVIARGRYSSGKNISRKKRNTLTSKVYTKDDKKKNNLKANKTFKNNEITY